MTIKPKWMRLCMMATIFGLFSGAGASAASPDNLPQASFDCAKATSPIEMLICSDEALAALDREMATLFAGVRHAIDGEEERLAQLKEQRAWLKARLTTCRIPTSGKLTGDTAAMRVCLIEEIRNRNEVLTAASKEIAPEVQSEAAPFDSFIAAREKELKISRISPAGDDVEKREQIVLQFNRPVVPIGKMERESGEIPVEISPAANCQWRWLNRSALACNLNESDYLAFATRYTVKVKPGITDEQGVTGKDPVEHTFITARPRVLSSRLLSYPTALSGWDGPGIPRLDVRFNQQVTKESVAAALFIEANGVRYALAVSPSPVGTKGTTLLVSLDKRQFWVKDSRRVEDEAVAVTDKTEEARLNWIVQPVKALPEDVEYTLKIAPGLISAFGPERGVEHRVIAQGATFPAFQFLGFSCTDNDERGIFIAAGSTEGKCSAFHRVSLDFSAPVSGKEVLAAFSISPPLSYKNSFLNPLAELNNQGSLSYQGVNHKKGVHYRLFLPEALKNSTEYTVEVKGAASKGSDKNTAFIKDVFGRSLPVDVRAAFVMDQYKPTMQWSGAPAVLEKNIDSDVAFYSTNLEQLILEGEIISGPGERRGITREIPLPGPHDQLNRSTFEVRKLFAGGSGLFAGKLKVKPENARIFNGGQFRDGNDFSAQVTPFHVHVKKGDSSCLVWVTDLQSGQPVKDAEVTLSKNPVSAKDKTTRKDLATARTNDAGVALLTENKETAAAFDEDYGMEIFVRKGQDLAYLSFNNTFYQYAGGGWEHRDPITAWGTTAEGVYKPGMEVNYKIYVRDMRLKGAELPKVRNLKLEIHDPKGSVVDTKDITLSAFGTYAGTFQTGKNGAAGRYQVFLLSKEKDPYLYLTPLDFLVTDYVPASFKVQTTLNKQKYEIGEEVAVDTAATLHSGGPFTEAANRYTATLYGEPFSSSYPATEKFIFGSSWCRPSSGCGKVSFLDEEIRLDQEGKARATFTAEGGDIGFGVLKVESAVEDDRGKRVANMATAQYFGVDRFVGLRMDTFVVNADKPVLFHFVVTDRDGKPVKGVKVDIGSSGNRYTAFRAKGAGNTYITRSNTEEVKDEGNVKELVSGETAGEFEMLFKDVGKNTLTASVSDTKGNSHDTELKFWVTGPDEIAWESSSQEYLDFVVEKTSYKVGETARVLVKNPFPKAKALITIERMGIVKSWVETFNSSLPLISFPVTEEMVPNFSLSVVVFSPRIDLRQTDDTFDLGKPEWRMGYAPMEAIGKKHSFDFAVKSDTKTYRPGQEVRVRLKVTPRDGVKTGPLELAVAVLDEAVFDLVKDGMDYFDPQKGFYGVRYDNIRNYNILRQLVTRAPTKKGDDPGGDGGMAGKFRADMKSLAFWNPAIITGDDGKTTFSFKAPDNLTGWRILVLAADKKDHLGVGYSDFKVNRPTEIQPAMPNQVVEGDTFTAAFTVMNRTQDRRTIKVEITASGTLANTNASTTEVVEVAPFERKMVKLSLIAGKVPVARNVENGLISFKIVAGDAVDRDSVVHNLVVHKEKNLEVGADYGTTSEGRVEVPFLFPEKIRADAGDVTATLSPTLIGDLEGAFLFMRDYPYECWEQSLSRAVMAANHQALKKYLAPDFVWTDSEGIVAKVLASAKDFQAPNGGMAFFKPDSERVDPYLSAFTAVCFTMLEKLGHKPPKAVDDKLIAYLHELLRTDVMPSFYSKGMASSVRAVALAALSRKGKADADMLRRHFEHIDQMDLFGKAEMLEAAIRTGGLDEMADTLLDRILGSSNETGGRLVFTETLDDGYSRVLSSVPRTNCAVLSSLLLAGDSRKNAEKLGDIPFRLARTIRTMRGQKDHFENTQENLFCMNGLVDYARRYEKVEPGMEVSVQFDDKTLGTSRFASFQDKPLVVSRPLDQTDPGKRKIMRIDKKGEGRFYYAMVMRYAPLNGQEKSVNAGIQVDREYHVEDRETGNWRQLANEDHIRRGDLVRVDLYLRLPAARTQIVVDDPIPGGLEPVNTELATASQVDAAKAEGAYGGGSLWLQFSDWQGYNFSFWSFNHQELRHDTARFFAEYLPPGNYHLSYTAQAVAEGKFTTQPVFAGEMYDADVYGKGVSGILHVDP